jgi:hypothetical protein
MILHIFAHHFLVGVQQEFKKNSEARLAPGGAVVDGGSAQARGQLPYDSRCVRVSNNPYRSGLSKSPATASQKTVPFG